MQKKYLIRAALIMMLIAGSYLLLWATSPTSSAKNNCCESMEECKQKKDNPGAPTDLPWENLGRQFFSIAAASN